MDKEIVMSSDIPFTAVAIVGGGPIGLELAIALGRAGVEYTLFEARQIGDAFSQWPPNTHFFSSTEHVALAGVPVHNLTQQAISGEEYLAYLRTLVEMFDVNLRVYEPVCAIERAEDGFVIRTNPLAGLRAYRCRHLILATGGMAGPRLLDIPGEDLPHVSHYFPGPHHYFRTRLLVVGGRNSAIESALRSWRAGAQVAISYRRPEFNMERIKPHLAIDLGDRLERHEIHFYAATMPVEITPSHVVLAHTDDGRTPIAPFTHVKADFVLLATGFVADSSLLKMAGIHLKGPEEAPVFDPETMETNVPGLYVAGTAVGGTQIKFQFFIATCHDHVRKIVRHISGVTPDKLGSVSGRNNAVTWEEVKAN
jgi:thioredoxin reductase (NADPH)